MAKQAGIGLGLAVSSNGLRITEIVPNGAAHKCAQIFVGDILRTIDHKTVTTIAEAKQLIVGDEGSLVALGLYRPSLGDFDICITRGTGIVQNGKKSVPETPRRDYSTWSVRDLKTALSESGVDHSWASEKSDLIALASENNVLPPGARRGASTSPGSGSAAPGSAGSSQSRSNGSSQSRFGSGGFGGGGFGAGASP
eukprot:CAMPEP_0172156568 /NCGR_PEP_ID=MMETSP1050-20130122/3287_1 /TAXON_ID=233186 /ORGANISM="Cryptomonas curvata, Strain CCAP979/52" /LENGTH=196 /DNA_ID=CAMNT_0012825659 /DNA_START=43 /DNA_END=630 /DNA_ORIENTATION=+